MSYLKDASVVAAIGSLAFAVSEVLFVAGFMFPVTPVVSLVCLGAAIAIFTIRLYARIVGPDNTKADDTLDAIEGEILDVSSVIPKKGSR